MTQLNQHFSQCKSSKHEQSLLINFMMDWNALNALKLTPFMSFWSKTRSSSHGPRTLEWIKFTYLRKKALISHPRIKIFCKCTRDIDVPICMLKWCSIEKIWAEGHYSGLNKCPIFSKKRTSASTIFKGHQGISKHKDFEQNLSSIKLLAEFCKSIVWHS